MNNSNENQSQSIPANPASAAAPTRVVAELADLQTRFFAAVIYGVAVGMVASAISVPIVLSMAVPWFLSPLLFSVIGFGVFAAANFKLLEKDGQTIGKRIMQLKIVKSDGSPPPVSDLLTKRYGIVWLASAIPYVGILLALGNVLLGLRDSRLAGHDEIAGTKVVNA